MGITQILFWFLSVLALFSAIMVVVSKSPIPSVLWLIFVFFAITVQYILLNAQFLAIVNLIVYAGAIMVLFLFIVMMLEIKPDGRPLGPLLRQWLPALLLCGVCLIVMTVFLLLAAGGAGPLPLVTASPLAFGRFLIQKYWLGVEIASFLLFVALVGALYLGRGNGTTGG